MAITDNITANTLKIYNKNDILADPHDAIDGFVLTRIGKHVEGYVSIKGGFLEPDVDTTIGTLIKYKPRIINRTALVHESGTTDSGSVSIAAGSGNVVVRVSSKPAYMSCSFSYFTDDI